MTTLAILAIGFFVYRMLIGISGEFEQYLILQRLNGESLQDIGGDFRNQGRHDQAPV